MVEVPRWEIGLNPAIQSGYRVGISQSESTRKQQNNKRISRPKNQIFLRLNKVINITVMTDVVMSTKNI
jgi:hypothetical protein